VTARDPLGDPQFLLPGDYVTLERHAEMFAWIEYNCRRDGQGHATCSYRRGWSAHPADSDRFHDPAGHHNPPMRFGSARFTADASIGVYHFATALAAMPDGTPVALSPDMIEPDAPEDPTLDAGYLYLGEHSVATAEVGDLRLSYAAFRPDQLATLFGEQHGGEVLAHVTDDGQRFYRVLRGDRAAAIATLAMEHRVLSWILRLAGVMLLWFALNLGLGPISAMFDLIPWLGRASRSLVAAVTMPVALVLGTAVVLLSTAAHHPVRAVLFLLALACLLAWLRRRNGGRA
jgi:hypothetical protein